METWSRRWWYGAAGAGCLAGALLATWPLVLHLSSTLPLGTEAAATIPLFDVWTLWWSGDRLWHGYAGLWDAPMFHPTDGSFALSEPMLLPGALAAPLFALRAPPALAHNLVLLAALATNGLFGCRVARALGAPRAPALASGLLVTTLPIVAKLLGELPLLSVGGSLAALDGLVRFGRDGRTRHAIAAAAGLVVQSLGGAQIALFATVLLGAAPVMTLAERRFARAAVARLGGALLIAVLVVAAVARAPLAVHERLGLHRDAALVQSLSARPIDYLSRPGGAILSFPAIEEPAVFTGGLFPGILVLGLALLGAVAPWPDRARRRWRWCVSGSGAAAFLLSLGLNLSLGGWQPFAALRALVPAFAEIRSVFRCALFVQVDLVVLAAAGLSAVRERLGHLAERISRHRDGLVLALGLVAAGENLSLPARLLPVPPSPRTAWTAFLARQPPGTVIAHVPFPRDGDVEELAIEAWRLFAQIDHRQPLVNGYASYFPALHRELMFAMGAQFPHHALACALHRVFGATLLVVDRDWLSARGPAFAALGPMMAPSYADERVAIYRLAPSAEECPPMRVEVGLGARPADGGQPAMNLDP